MELRHEIWWTLGGLSAVSLLLAFGVIGLLTRMSPAVERILHENVESNEAAEQMLAVLASTATAATSATSDRRTRFADALSRARENITEPEESAVLDALERDHVRALDGDASAAAAVVRGALELTAINRRAMMEADGEAQRLGQAGAWTAAALGALAFILSLLARRRLDARILSPLEDLHDVLAAAQRGDHLRRCRPAHAPAEIQRALDAVNTLLDSFLSRALKAPAGGVAEAPTYVEQNALVALLESQPGAAFVVDAAGGVRAANARGLSLLAAPEGENLRRRLSGGGDGYDPSELSRTSFAGGALFTLPASGPSGA